MTCPRKKCDGHPDCPWCGEFSEYGRSPYALTITASLITIAVFLIWAALLVWMVW